MVVDSSITHSGIQILDDSILNVDYTILASSYDDMLDFVGQWWDADSNACFLLQLIHETLAEVVHKWMYNSSHLHIQGKLLALPIETIVIYVKSTFTYHL